MLDKYIFKDEKYSVKTILNILALIFVLSGIFGFIYEMIFYRIDLGYFIKRGSTFGPWIPIYAFGGILITLATYRFRKNPFLVFIINCIITGVLEYATGFILYTTKGIRLWDYNTEIWNWGNINGYICARSILFFGLSSLFMIYVMIPGLKWLTKKVSERNLSIISIALFFAFVLDIVIYAMIK